jgi:hypothetical protein
MKLIHLWLVWNTNSHSYNAYFGKASTNDVEDVFDEILINFLFTRRNRRRMKRRVKESCSSRSCWCRKVKEMIWGRPSLNWHLACLIHARPTWLFFFSFSFLFLFLFLFIFFCYYCHWLFLFFVTFFFCCCFSRIR